MDDMREDVRTVWRGVGLARPVISSSTSSLTVQNIHELDASIAGPTSDEEWRESTRWPATLKTSRTSYPKIGSKVIITGGSNGRKLRNKEILDLTSRTL